VGPQENFQVTKVQFAENTTEPNVMVRGGNEYFVLHNAYNIEMGRNFTPQDVQNARNMVIIGHDIFRDLFEGVDPINKEIRIDGRPYQVIGVTESKGAVFGNSQDRFVVAPYTTMLNVYGGTSRDIAIQVSAISIDKIEDAIDELTGLMRLIRKVEPGDANDFEIVTNESLGSAFDQFTGVLYIIGFVVGGISLLGAGIGVMNIMLVSVTERTREIGVRKAVGATKKAIVSQFLMEAVAICQIGGLVGIIIGAAMGNALSFYLETSIVFPWMAAFMGVLGMTITGLLFGVYPAFKASELDPIESLRYE
jgi:putative ABC transport system permease protein